MKFVFLITFIFISSIISGQAPPITPLWALGHIVWEDSINSQDGAIELVTLYKDNNIPVSGVIIDSPWSTSYNDFNWDPARYSDPTEMLGKLKGMGIRTILWTTGTVNITGKDVPIQKCKTYDYVVEKGYGINNGKPTRWWKGDGIHIDFTNQDASNWWKTQLDKISDCVYGYKVDQAEGYFGDTVTTSVGEISNKNFRKYYYDFMFDYATDSKPTEGIIMARPYSYQGGTSANIEKLSLGWCGDFEGNYDGLINQIKDIYQSSILGYGAIGCEIGGFYGAQATDSQLIRYCQFASMTASMINGGSNGPFSSHMPWYHSEEVTAIYKFYTALHYELRPYIFTTLVDCHKSSGGLLRNCDMVNICHLLGTDIFCKPIVSDYSQIVFFVPEENDWVDFWTKTTVKGGTEISYEYPLDKMPLFIRKGSIIPLNICSSITGLGDSSMRDKVVLLILPNGNTKRIVHYPISEGISYEDVKVEVDQETTTIDIKSNVYFDYSILIWVDSKNIIRRDISGTDVHFDYSLPTSMTPIQNNKEKFIYSLSGAKVKERTQRGIFLEEGIDNNGHKVFVKIFK